MLGQFLRRLIAALPTLLAILIAVFLLLRFAPGGPFDASRHNSSPIERQLGSAYERNGSLASQVSRYAQGLARGDLGPSMVNADKGVAEIVIEGAAVSAVLTISALVLALTLGTGLGVIAALRPGTILDRALAGGATLFLCLSPLLLGPVLQRVFAINTNWLPAAGLDRDLIAAPNLMLPIFSLALPFIALVTRHVRASMGETLSSDACRAARAKGLPETQVLWNHAAPAVMLALVKRIGVLVSGIGVGSLAVETLFQLPGVGRALVLAARQHDASVVAGIVFVYAVALVVLVWIADLIARALDPRMRAA